MKRLGIIVIGLAMLVALTGVVMAAVLPPQTPEIQGISTSTVIQCDGIVLTSVDYANENSNQALDGAPLAAKEVYGASAYNAQMIALTGSTQLVKTVDISTKNQLINGKNVDVATDLVYQGVNGGFVTGEENLMQFNAGQAGTKAADAILCPFGTAKDTQLPPFNEAVVMGSKYDLTSGTVASTAGMTTTAATADVPSQTQYAIESTGAGSISTYMSVFAQDARGNGKTPITLEKTVTVPALKDRCGRVIVKEHKETIPAVYSAVTPSAVTQYTEKSSAMGQFTFAKTMAYTSGIVG